MATAEVRDDLFNKYEALQKQQKFNPQCIFNMDETGLQIVSKPTKIASRRGQKEIQVKQVGERSDVLFASTSPFI